MSKYKPTAKEKTYLEIFNYFNGLKYKISHNNGNGGYHIDYGYMLSKGAISTYAYDNKLNTKRQIANSKIQLSAGERHLYI